MSDTSTRSGMLWEVERILKELKETDSLPQVLLMENVPMIHSIDNTPDFNKWQIELTKLGYKNYWEDLIATDYGIPQTRNRTFMVSILGDYNYTFPRKQELKIRLKDMLEEDVPEKYYLSKAMIDYVCSRMPSGEHHITTGINMRNKDNSIKVGSITTGEGSKASSNYIIDSDKYDYDKEEGRILRRELSDNLIKNNKVKENDVIRTNYTTRVLNGEKEWYLGNNLSPTLTTRSCDEYGVVCTYDEYNDKINGNETIGTIQAMYPTPNHGHRLIIKNNTKQGYLEAEDGDGVDISTRMEYHRGTVQKGKTQSLTTKGGENNGVVIGTYQYAKSDNFMQGKDRLQLGKETNDTLQTTPKEGVVNSDLRIRKLTPKECFRLMGVKDEDYEKCAKNQSDSSLYHLAGDSIVVDVIYYIFKEMIK